MPLLPGTSSENWPSPGIGKNRSHSSEVRRLQNIQPAPFARLDHFRQPRSQQNRLDNRRRPSRSDLERRIIDTRKQKVSNRRVCASTPSQFLLTQVVQRRHNFTALIKLAFRNQIRNMSHRLILRIVDGVLFASKSSI